MSRWKRSRTEFRFFDGSRQASKGVGEHSFTFFSQILPRMRGASTMGTGRAGRVKTTSEALTARGCDAQGFLAGHHCFDDGNILSPEWVILSSFLARPETSSRPFFGMSVPPVALGCSLCRNCEIE